MVIPTQQQTYRFLYLKQPAISRNTDTSENKVNILTEYVEYQYLQKPTNISIEISKYIYNYICLENIYLRHLENIQYVRKSGSHVELPIHIESITYDNYNI